MSRTKKHRMKFFREAIRRVKPYKRVSRRQLVEEFEEQYRLRNQQPIIRL